MASIALFLALQPLAIALFLALQPLAIALFLALQHFESPPEARASLPRFSSCDKLLFITRIY